VREFGVGLTKIKEFKDGEKVTYTVYKYDGSIK
jgi:hypothetical protein